MGFIKFILALPRILQECLTMLRLAFTGRYSAALVLILGVLFGVGVGYYLKGVAVAEEQARAAIAAAKKQEKMAISDPNIIVNGIDKENEIEKKFEEIKDEFDENVEDFDCPSIGDEFIRLYNMAVEETRKATSN